jgi:hypothetical protein
VAERLGDVKIVVTCRSEHTELALSGKLETRDQLDALQEALTIMRDWLSDEQSERTAA